MNAAGNPTEFVMANALAACIQRLEDVLDLENAALVERRDADLQECSRRKSRALLELTRMSRGVAATSIDPAARRGLERLREKLVRNRDLLEININAVREVSDILSRVIAAAESDGTYSAHKTSRYT